MHEFSYIGCLAFSLAGHDKGSLYVIINKEDDTVYLADGRLKTTEHPKKKKLKHLQIVKKKNYYLSEDDHNPGTDKAVSFTNEKIKRVIKLFKREGKEES